MKIWKILFTNKRVFKHTEVVSNLHVCSNCIGKMLPFSFYFSTRILPSSHTKVFNIFSHYICRNVQQSIFSSR